jgi:hypothetical protein
MEEQIKARIAELEKEREQVVAQANQQIAAYGGAIAELKKLIEPKPEQPAS